MGISSIHDHTRKVGTLYVSCIEFRFVTVHARVVATELWLEPHALQPYGARIGNTVGIVLKSAK